MRSRFLLNSKDEVTPLTRKQMRSMALDLSWNIKLNMVDWIYTLIFDPSKEIL